jgi:hypothetical protein
LIKESNCKLLCIFLHSKSVLRHYLLHEWLDDGGVIHLCLISLLDVLDILTEKTPVGLAELAVRLVTNAVLVERHRVAEALHH